MTGAAAVRARLSAIYRIPDTQTLRGILGKIL
jgi:hypothetical protein